MTTAFLADQLPKRASMNHDEALVVNGNALARTIDTGQLDNFFVRQSASANADAFTHSVFLQAGTYIFTVVGQTNTGNAIIDWYLDDVAFIASQDWYAGAQNKNVVKTGSVAISVVGYHVLRGTINGRNGANVTAYNMDLTRYWLKQATD